MLNYRVGLIVTYVIAGACGGKDPITVQVDPPRHELHLEWAGKATGSFAVAGAMPSTTLDYNQPFVQSTSGTTNGRPVRLLIGNRPGSAYFAGGTDIVYVMLDESITGPGKFGPGNCSQVAELRDCFRVSAMLGVPIGGGNVSWILESITGLGHLEITHWSADRVVATFDGLFAYRPGVSNGAPPDTLTVTNGFVDAMNAPGTHWPP